MKVELKVNEFIKKHDKWTIGLNLIRQVLLETELDEDIKWGMPTYRLNGKNVVSFAGFKNHFGVWFHNGSFLKDEHKILENAQEGKTKGMRHIKFTDSKDVDIDVLKSYFLEAIENQKEGKEINPTRKSEILSLPEFLESNLSENELAQLLSVSNSKRNEFIEYITTAKRESTKIRRLEKIKPMIKQGLGLNDQYKSK